MFKSSQSRKCGEPLECTKSDRSVDEQRTLREASHPLLQSRVEAIPKLGHSALLSPLPTPRGGSSWLWQMPNPPLVGVLLARGLINIQTAGVCSRGCSGGGGSGGCEADTVIILNCRAASVRHQPSRAPRMQEMPSGVCSLLQPSCLGLYAVQRGQERLGESPSQAGGLPTP